MNSEVAAASWSGIADCDHRQLVAEVDMLIRHWLLAGEEWGGEDGRRPSLDQLLNALLRICGMRRLRLEVSFDGCTYALGEHGRSVVEDYSLEEAALRLLHRELQETVRENQPRRLRHRRPVLTAAGGAR